MDRALIDKLYAEVPEERKREFLDFVDRHPLRRTEVAGNPFEYIAGGAGSRALLLLPGLLGSAYSLYQQALEFERDHRVLAITYPDSVDIDGQLAAISTVLEAEEVGEAVVVGQTLGGYLAQAYVWAQSQQVPGIALVHAGLPDPELGIRLGRKVALMALLPPFLLSLYLRSILLRMVASLESRGEVEPEQARLVAAQLRYRFARLVDRRRILARYRLILRIHAMPVPEPGSFAGAVQWIYSQGNVFSRNPERFRRQYPGARESVLGRGHNISLLVKPHEANRILREFLESL